ncbi:MAG: Gfo/Idh/MocA family oxidoreductase [Desulfosudaceae bacterium]
MRNIRVGVIGTGYLGKFHAEKYAHMPGAELVGVVDTDQAAAEAVADRLKVTACTDYRDLLDQVEAVSIVVPTPGHFPIARDCLENDIDVLVEKPMTTTLAEAESLIETAEARGKILQVGHLERFNPAVHPLKGIVSRPLFIESHRLSLYNERGTDVSVVLDLMIHDIDIILNFVKSGVKMIRAAGLSVISEHVDIANARLEFDSGCVANVTASRISNRNERKLRLFQKDSYISVDFGNSEITVIDKSGHDGGGPIPGLSTRHLSFTRWDALEQELTAFVNCVRTRSRPEVSGQEGRQALRIALEVMDQIHQTEKMVEQSRADQTGRPRE